MNNLYTRAAYFSAGFTAGNVIWQIIGNHLWGVAAERSFFQAFAIFVFAYALKTRPR